MPRNYWWQTLQSVTSRSSLSMTFVGNPPAGVLAPCGLWQEMHGAKSGSPAEAFVESALSIGYAIDSPFVTEPFWPNCAAPAAGSPSCEWRWRSAAEWHWVRQRSSKVSWTPHAGEAPPMNSCPQVRRVLVRVQLQLHGVEHPVEVRARRDADVVAGDALRVS